MSQQCRRDGPRGAGVARRIRIGRPILRHLLRPCRSLLPCTQSLNWGICPSSVTGFLKCDAYVRCGDIRVASCFTGGMPCLSPGSAHGKYGRSKRHEQLACPGLAQPAPGRGRQIDRILGEEVVHIERSNDRPLSSMMRSTIFFRLGALKYETLLFMQLFVSGRQMPRAYM